MTRFSEEFKYSIMMKMMPYIKLQTCLYTSKELRNK